MGIPFLDAVGSPRQKAQNFFAEQSQKFGLPASVIAGILSGGSNLPHTRARLSHAYYLKTGRNQIIGACFRTEQNESRTIDRELEIEPNAVGEPADLVPQDLTEQSFQLARWDLYDSIFEEIFGGEELVMLTDQYRGFRLREVWRSPSAFLNSRGRLYEYAPCWFATKGRTVETTGDRTVRVNGRLEYMRRQKVAG